MRRKAFWGLIAAALIVTPAVVGLLVMGGGSSRTQAALVSEGAGTYELTVAGLTPAGQAVDVLSYSWGVQAPAGATGRAQFSGLTITKKLDETSPLFAQGAALGKNYATAVLKLAKPGEKPYATYTLTNAQVTSVQHSGEADNIPSEQVALNYSKLSVEVASVDAAGKLGTPNRFSYDLNAAKAG